MENHYLPFDVLPLPPEEAPPDERPPLFPVELLLDDELPVAARPLPELVFFDEALVFEEAPAEDLPEELSLREGEDLSLDDEGLLPPSSSSSFLFLL
jgi:hypothetical protein